MDTQKVTAKYRMSQWMQIIKRRQESGLNIKEFCESTGISRHSYFYWQRKLREATCAELSKAEESTKLVPTGWTQLVPTQEEVKSTLDIEVSGFHITVNAQTDPELLKKVCHMLRSL
ncbi:MAG: IS66 family insertion sequence element accessory protein TnpA [Caldicoprobacterales bacterium]|jgi:putative transposase